MGLQHLPGPLLPARERGPLSVAHPPHCADRKPQARLSTGPPWAPNTEGHTPELSRAGTQVGAQVGSPARFTVHSQPVTGRLITSQSSDQATTVPQEWRERTALLDG